MDDNNTALDACLPTDITQLLENWCDGDREALDRLISNVFGELHRMARHHVSRGGYRCDLTPTELVGEVYLKLVRETNLSFENRNLFFAFASKLMRHVLVDLARSKQTEKRGGGNTSLSFDDAIEIPGKVSLEPDSILALDQVLNRLQVKDPRMAQIVELRFFGGLKNREIAQILGLSQATIQREWGFAKRWMTKVLVREAPPFPVEEGTG